MKRWALVTIGLYAVVAIPLAALLVLACFVPEIKAGDWSEVYLDIDDGAWITWAFIAFMVLAQALLLVVPVRQAGERPVRRRHVFWTLLAAVLLLVLLAVGMILAVYETIANTRNTHGHIIFNSEPFLFAILCAVGAVWMAWAFVWAFYAGGREPKTMMQRLVRMLIAGSILELLVCVPMHILARMRNYCCAGFLTFWGIATGVSVMLLAFGPGVFWLFVRRYRALRPAETKK